MALASSPLAGLTIAEAAGLLGRREVSAVDLVQAVLERIAHFDSHLHAYVRTLDDQALAAARAVDQARDAGQALGPLAGVPIALKDLYDVAGVPTTASSRVRANHVAATDSTVTQRLKQAGAVIVGKTVTHEFAYGVVSAPTRNPWNLDCIPGGSSGGSGAAVAADLCLGAFGSDTGGSIRIPAALTGCSGLKPTFGRVSKAGVAPLSWSLDHAGPMGKSAEDLALLLNAVAGVDPRDPTTAAVPVPDFTADLGRGLRGLRVGLPAYYFERLDPEVEQAVLAAIRVLEQEGVQVREVAIPELALSLAMEFTIVFPEASAYHQPTLRRQPEDYGADVRLLLEAGELHLATHYLKAQRARALLKQALRRALAWLYSTSARLMQRSSTTLSPGQR